MFRMAVFTLMFIAVNLLSAQNDSLLNELENASDQDALQILDQICISAGDTGILHLWANKLIDLSIEQDDAYYEAMGHHHLGRYFGVLGRIPESVLQHRRAAELFASVDRVDKMARQFVNLGNRFADIGQYDSALAIYERAESFAIEAKDTMALYGSLLNISTIHHDRGDKAKELDYMMKAKDLVLKMGSEDEKALMHYNIAVYYIEQREVEKALELADLAFAGYTKTNNLFGLGSVYMLKAQAAQDTNNYLGATIALDSSIALYRRAGDIDRVGLILMNQGAILNKQGKAEEGYQKMQEAYDIFIEVGDRRFEAKTLFSMGEYWFQKGSQAKGFELVNQAITIGEEIYVRSDLIEWYNTLGSMYSKSGQGKKAYEASMREMALKDSAHAENSEEAIAEAEARFQNQKKQLDIERLTQEKQAQESALMLERSRKNWILIGLTLAIIMVLIVGYALLQKRKDNKLISNQKQEVERQNELISHQKLLVEEKNKEITDSINYAQRIQEAILPEPSAWFAALPKSMVLYMPKDIVAGDFYWLVDTDDSVYFAAADCTGHGVPGAMVSVVCHNALNRALREYRLKDTGQILDKVRELVVETFLAESKDTIKDGMDIALCALQKSVGENGTRKMQFSGAHNPLWIASNKNYELASMLELDGFKLYELKADKQPIGKFEAQKPFNTHELELNAGDKLYLFSDGYADQFGGDRGKKLKPKAMRSKILEIHSMDFETQKMALSEHIESWRGDLEQIDDICIIGVEV